MYFRALFHLLNGAKVFLLVSKFPPSQRHRMDKYRYMEQPVGKGFRRAAVIFRICDGRIDVSKRL